jgi:hypothetical protein
MNAKSLLAALLVATLAAFPQPARGQGAATFTVRNDTNRTMMCAVRKAGSARADDLRMAPGETWTRDYPKPKPRAFRCEGAAPIWYPIHAGSTYRIVPNRDGLIVIALAGGGR